jgi:hypothetical protein
MSRIFEAIFRGGKSSGRFPKVEPAQSFRCGSKFFQVVRHFVFCRCCLTRHVAGTRCHLQWLSRRILHILGFRPIHCIAFIFIIVVHKSGLQHNRYLHCDVFRLQNSDHQQHELGRIYVSKQCYHVHLFYVLCTTLVSTSIFLFDNSSACTFPCPGQCFRRLLSTTEFHQETMVSPASAANQPDLALSSSATLKDSCQQPTGDGSPMTPLNQTSSYTLGPLSTS